MLQCYMGNRTNHHLGERDKEKKTNDKMIGYRFVPSNASYLMLWCQQNEFQKGNVI